MFGYNGIRIANPELRDASILTRTQPVKIGEPSKTNISRTVRVDAITPAADGVVMVTSPILPAKHFRSGRQARISTSISAI